MSEAESSTGSNVHLLVLVHGMWGNPGHLASMQQVYDDVRGVTNPDADAGPAWVAGLVAAGWPGEARVPARPEMDRIDGI